MKEHFEEALHAVKKVVEKGVSGRKAEEFVGGELKKEKLAEMIPFASRLDVFEMQKEKQGVMDWLHEQLEKIDNGEEVESFTKNTRPYSVGADMVATLPSGEKVPVTAGELASDGDWGVEYSLDADVPRNEKKRYVIAEAKREIMRLLNRQIGVTESQREIPKWMGEGLKTHMGHIKHTYEIVLNEDPDHLPAGLIAEKMLQSYFKKLEIDDGVPFTFQEADVSDDIERKIDFFIHKRTHTRGVGAAEPEERDDIGIQLTTDPSREKQEHKMRQIERSKKEFGLKDVDDIVLVTLPLHKTGQLYRRWVNDGAKPGGPTKYWTDDVKEEVFRGVLKGFFDDADIEKILREIKEKK